MVHNVYRNTDHDAAQDPAPIMLAGMGAVSGAPLAAAVSNAGMFLLPLLSILLKEKEN
jgi:NAD(P)H-dependent flavin oxidoreductase YrpB (nitropropane dioxygenase family)